MDTTLFVLGTLGAGGSATSMINLLTLMEEKYGVQTDVLLFHREGVFSKENDYPFHIIPCDPVLWFLAMNKKIALKQRPLFTAMMLVIYQLLSMITGGRYQAKKCLYKWRAKKFTGKYANVVAYQEENVTEFCGKIGAKNKIAWVHSNIETFPTLINKGEQVLLKMYESFNKIVCVSKATRQAFCRRLPQYEQRTEVIYNPFMSTVILEKADAYAVKKNGLSLVSVGRFTEQKRFDRIPKIAEMLIQEKVDFHWYIVGDGELFNEIELEIKKKGLQEVVTLTGKLDNPFPYMKMADCVVLTSDSEAHPMVANEALILGTPVISTPFPSVYEIITHGVNGLIASEKTSVAVSCCIKRIVDNDLVRKRITDGAKSTVYGNENILNAVRAILM